MVRELINRLRDRADKRRNDNDYSIGPDILDEAADTIASLTAELSALRACEGTDTDTRPRYSMKRMRDEIAKAKEYARAEALEETAIMVEARAGEYDAGFDETEYKTAYLAASAALMALAASIRALMVKP